MECMFNRRGERRRSRPRSIFPPVTGAQWLCSYWLERAERRVSKSFGERLKAYGIIASEWSALREMYRPGRTSSLALAPAIGMTKGGASKLIGRLVKKRLARRTVGELDRRCRPVRITRRGKNLVWELAMYEEKTDRRFFPKEKLRYHLTRALKGAANAWPNGPVDVLEVPLWKMAPVKRPGHSSGATPPPSAVANKASNSSDDSSRNLPRDK
jgi:DNA-binding MarR family transcriptional regulator